MMELVLAWLLPLLAGAGVWQTLLGRPRAAAQWAGVIGYGYLVGVLLTGAMCAVFAAADTQHALRHVGPLLALLAVAGWFWSWRRGAGPMPMLAPIPTSTSVRGWRSALVLLLFAILLLRAVLLIDEVWLRPTFPWDAWSAWAVRPKTWYLLGHADPFVAPPLWLASSDAALRTTAIWQYPSLLGWIQVWFASAAGEWNEPMVNLPWAGIWIALLLASYAQWRELRLTPPRAMIATYVLGSLPLLNAHVALAGYADLWLATVFGLAVLAALVGLQQGRRGPLLAGLALALCLPAIKLEGGVWLGCFAVIAAFVALPRRARAWFVGATLLILLFGIAVGGFALPLPGLGLVHIAWGEIDLPGKGVLLLQWHPVGREILATLFSLPNWHLLWFLVPPIVLLRWRVLLHDESACWLGLLLLLCLLFLFVLFFFTEASRWAEDFTSANRLILQITPAVVTLLALLLRDASSARRTVTSLP